MGVGLAVTGIIIALAGTVTSVVAATQEAEAAEDAAKAEQQIALQEVAESARAKRRENERQNILDRVGFLDSGLRASEGTPLAVLVANAGEREKEALDIERFGNNRATLAGNRARSAAAAGTNVAVGRGLSGLGSASQSGASLLSSTDIFAN